MTILIAKLSPITGITTQAPKTLRGINPLIDKDYSLVLQLVYNWFRIAYIINLVFLSHVKFASFGNIILKGG